MKTMNYACFKPEEKATRSVKKGMRVKDFNFPGKLSRILNEDRERWV